MNRVNDLLYYIEPIHYFILLQITNVSASFLFISFHYSIIWSLPLMQSNIEQFHILITIGQAFNLFVEIGMPRCLIHPAWIKRPRSGTTLDSTLKRLLLVYQYYESLKTEKNYWHLRNGKYFFSFNTTLHIEIYSYQTIPYSVF